MPYCSGCGVEVDNLVEICPVCKTPIQKFPANDTGPQTPYPQENWNIEKEKKLIDKQNHYMAWMIFSVLLFTPFFVILTISIQLKTIQTWAGYPLVSLVALWIIITLFIFFLKKPVILATGIMVTSGILMMAIDLIDGSFQWFLPLGLPNLILIYILSLIVVFISIRVKVKGLNIGAFIIIASCIFCCILDIMLSLYFYGKILPTWSFVVISSMLPMALFLLILHYILKKKIKFKRVFHL